MTKEQYDTMEQYMNLCMKDSAHDKEHVYRVLYYALEIAKYETNVNYDVLICACLLHDVGRAEQFENPQLCHAEVGAQKAGWFLSDHGYDEDYAEAVAHCILCHRYRNNNVPQTLEAKILFDADKLDATGAVGIARTLIYKGQVSEPLYRLDVSGMVSNGENDTEPSFFQEYKYKLEKLYDKFYTKRGTELAKANQKAAVSYYESLFREVSSVYSEGVKEMSKYIANTM